MQKIAILGSTGSIGCQCLDVIRRNIENFEVVALACFSNLELFEKQVFEFKPKYVVIKDNNARKNFSSELREMVVMLDDVLQIVQLEEVKSIMFSTVGFSGTTALLEGIKLKKKIMLANKEALVCAGELVVPLAKANGVEILPVDSEHSAIWQCLNSITNKKSDIKKIILTASGGAFRDFSYEQLECVKACDALKHPNWNMGKKITVDCATMMNKGFEVIEAKYLFDVEVERIDAVLHKESIIHSMVMFNDNSTLAQMSHPTMEIPISLALNYPSRKQTTVQELNFEKIATLHFEKIDEMKYPCFALAKQALQIGGTMPTILNAGNEVFVDAFLKDKISFVQIAHLNEKVMQAVERKNVTQIDDIVQADFVARSKALSLIE